MTSELLDPRMRPLVLRQILLTQKALPALLTLERPRSDLVRLLVRFKRIFRGEVFTAQLTHIRPHTSVRVYVFIK